MRKTAVVMVANAKDSVHIANNSKMHLAKSLAFCEIVLNFVGESLLYNFAQHLYLDLMFQFVWIVFGTAWEKKTDFNACL